MHSSRPLAIEEQLLLLGTTVNIAVTGSPNHFVRGQHKPLHNSSRDGGLT